MNVEQIYTGCLAQAAYFIESDGEAVVIDPLRETKPYLNRVMASGAKLKYVFETHFHADFVSGHLDLSRETGAEIVYGPGAKPAFKAHIAKDNEDFIIGRLRLRLLHTPGHTLESSCFLLFNEENQPQALFTGDTLFLGDVGRPDLAVKSDLTKEDLAALLYDSLHKKIIPLPDNLTVYPGHGAGSACGKHLSSETSDNLGRQKQTNYALLAPNKAAFVKTVLDGMTAPPSYFSEDARLNREGYAPVSDVLKMGLAALEPKEFRTVALQENALLLDTRSPQDFHLGFIPRSINIGVDGSFASWAGSLLGGVHQPILLIVDLGREEEVVTRLARVGYDRLLGVLKGGMTAWKTAGFDHETLPSISPQVFAEGVGKPILIDVRNPGEYLESHVAGALNIPLAQLNQSMEKISNRETLYIHCASGYRSMVAASILKARGFDHVINVEGGFKGLRETDLQLVSTQFKLAEEKQ